MATGTNSTEIDELKEMVRQLTNRVDILSASNTDLNTKLVKAKELFDAQNADLNARLVKSQEQVITRYGTSDFCKPEGIRQDHAPNLAYHSRLRSLARVSTGNHGRCKW